MVSSARTKDEIVRLLIFGLGNPGFSEYCPTYYNHTFLYSLQTHCFAEVAIATKWEAKWLQTVEPYNSRKILLHYSTFLGFFKNFYLFFSWERAQVGEGQREKGKENLKQALHCQHRAHCGAQTQEPWDDELNWNQEADTKLTEPPSHPCNFVLQRVRPK